MSDVDGELCALMLGEMADALFERWCRERKVNPIDALVGGPLLVLEAARKLPPLDVLTGDHHG